MVITKTPLRISFFGGGTDYVEWSRNNGGSVLSTTIDKYLYISCRHRPPFFEHKSRIVWSQIENVQDHRDIQHPAVRAALEHLAVEDGVEIHYDADVPARTGLGSSSSFTVGLLHALYALKGSMVTKEDLAATAIHIEQNLVKENVGSQDQIAAAYGGLNKILFHQDGRFEVHPVPIALSRLEELERHCMLVFTGFTRTASEIATEQIRCAKNNGNELNAMKGMVDQAITILSHGSLDEFGKLLHEAWMLKRSLAGNISNSTIDAIYETGRRAGAIGGKLLGAGGGGFLLFFVPPEKRALVKMSLQHLLEIPFRFETGGSQVIFYKPYGPSSRL